MDNLLDMPGSYLWALPFMCIKTQNSNKEDQNKNLLAL